MLRGEKIFNDVLRIINGERKDQYGDPEDSFKDISVRWTQFLRGRGKLRQGEGITECDVSLMLADFKLARECHCHKRDNLVDAVGYLAICDSMENC